MDVSMHSINAVFLLGDVFLNGLVSLYTLFVRWFFHLLNVNCDWWDLFVFFQRFPFFRIAYFILLTGIFVIFQWIIHACVSMWYAEFLFHLFFSPPLTPPAPGPPTRLSLSLCGHWTLLTPFVNSNTNSFLLQVALSISGLVVAICSYLVFISSHLQICMLLLLTFNF